MFYSTHFGIHQRYLQGISYLTVQFLVHQLAVNTCQNALVKYSLLTDAVFFKISQRSLTMSNS